MKTTITATIARTIAQHGPLTKQQLTRHLPGLQQSSVGYLLRSDYIHVAKMIENPGRGSGQLQVYGLTAKGRKMAAIKNKPAPAPPRWTSSRLWRRLATCFRIIRCRWRFAPTNAPT